MDTAVHCLPEWQAPVWVLTGFACYSARKSRSYHAGFRKCSYTCCACYSPFPIIASAIFRMEISGNRRLVCQKAKRTDAVNGGAAARFFRPARSAAPFCRPPRHLSGRAAKAPAQGFSARAPRRPPRLLRGRPVPAARSQFVSI